MKTIKICLIFLGLGLLTSCKYFKEHRLFSKDVDTIMDMSSEPVVDLVPDTTEYIEVVEEVEPMPVEEPTVQTALGNSRFFMIVGSFQNEHFAQDYADDLQKLGYQSQVIYADNGFYRVSAKTYGTYQEGLQDIENFRSAVSGNAWLHVRK